MTDGALGDVALLVLEQLNVDSSPPSVAFIVDQVEHRPFFEARLAPLRLVATRRGPGYLMCTFDSMSQCRALEVDTDALASVLTSMVYVNVVLLDQPLVLPINPMSFYDEHTRKLVTQVRTETLGEARAAIRLLHATLVES